MTESSDTGTSALPPKRQYYGKTVKLSAVWTFGSNASSRVVLLAVSAVLARLLTPAEFGIVAASQFFMTLAMRLSQLGLNASLVRMKDIREEHLSSVFLLNLVMGAAAFAALWGISPLVGAFFDEPEVSRVLPVAAITFLIVPMGSIPSALLSRHLRYKATNAIRWCDAVMGSLIAMVLAWQGWGYWSLVFGALAGSVITTAARWWLAPWRPSLRFSGAALRETLGFGLGFQARGLLTFASGNLDNLIIGRFLGINNLGYYDKAFNLTGQVTNRLAVDGILFRVLAVISEEPQRLKRAIVKSLGATSLVSLPLLVFIAVAAHRIIPVVFGPQWDQTIGPLRVLAVASLLTAVLRPVNSALTALGLIWRLTGIQVLQLVVLVSAVALAAPWGLTAAAAGVLVARALDAVLSLRVLIASTSLKYSDFWVALWPSLATVTILPGAVIAVEVVMASMHVSSDWIVLIAEGAAAGAAYGAAVLWSPFPSIRAVVSESLDDLVPGLRQRFPIGVLGVQPKARGAR